MIHAYFENIEREIISAIDSSESRLYAAVAWFTNQAIFDRLIQACQRQVKIKIILLDDIINRNEFGLNFGILAGKGADIRFSKVNLGTMHNKYCIIDNKVITGSYNWTYSANRNNENVILTDDPDVVKNYYNEFENLLNTACSIKLPYEHLNWLNVEEGDFAELRRNIFRDVVAQNDSNKDLKRVKLINIDKAYKSGKKEDLQKASSLPIIGHLKTITDVLIGSKQNYVLCLWENNVTGEPYDNGIEYISFDKWFYVPFEIKEDKYHQAYVEGVLKAYSSLNYGLVKGLKLKVFDNDFVKVIRTFWGNRSYDDYELIPQKVLMIEHAKMCYYSFPAPMFNKSQTQIENRTKEKALLAINILGIAKEVNGNNVVFYDGWDPQKRGEKIVKELFVKTGVPEPNSLPIEECNRTITDVLTSQTRKYEGGLYYFLEWDLDEQPKDVTFSTVGKWIFIPEQFRETKHHEKYIRGYLHYYPRF